MAMHFALWRNYRIQMVMAKSHSLCGAPLVAAAALGTDMGFVRLGGNVPAPPIPAPLPGLAGGLWGGLPTSGRTTCLAWGMGSSRQLARSQASPG